MVSSSDDIPVAGPSTLPALDTVDITYTPSQISLAKKSQRQRRLALRLRRALRIPPSTSLLTAARVALTLAGLVWIAALPIDALWKGMGVDEHALQPAQVTMYFDWGDVHIADTYLGVLEGIVDEPFELRSKWMQDVFASSGLQTGNTSLSTWAYISPPRSAGLETIILTAPWLSQHSTSASSSSPSLLPPSTDPKPSPNLRGVATLLSLAHFLARQGHWAFDIAIVVGEGQLQGVEEFMGNYHDLFPGQIWTGINVDYPGHSFEHLGLFYEGTNGRLPNQDVLNTLSHVARYSTGVDVRVHDIDPSASTSPVRGLGKAVEGYWVGARHLVQHFKYAALGRPSGAHGLLAKHRIDAFTLYCPPATGPHGFHTLGRTIESTLRSFNNLLERLHASYFFYLLPAPDRYMPVGHYLPAAVLLGAALTMGGFDCPVPVTAVVGVLVPALLVSALAWFFQRAELTLLALLAPILSSSSTSTPKDDQLPRSARSLTNLFFGALISTLAMVNFPQSILLALVVHAHLSLPLLLPLPPAAKAGILALLGPGVWVVAPQLRETWEVAGGLAWPGVVLLWPIMYLVAAL